MPILDRMGRLIPDLSQVFDRFPVPIVVCVMAAIILNLDIADIETFNPAYWAAFGQERIYGGLLCAFLASGATHLYAEARALPTPKSTLLALGVAVLAMLVCWLLRPLQIQFVFIVPGLVLSVMVAAYLGRKDRTNALWMFNARLALAVVLAGLVTVVFGGGLSAIVESIRYLFGVRFDSFIHQHIWATGVVLVGAIFGLSMVSDDLEEGFLPDGQSGLLVRGTLTLLKFLLIPLALVYVVILHLYAAKMAMDWSLPKGQVGIMVLIFSLGGAGVWLIASPWRQSQSGILHLFHRAWFWSLLVPLCLLAIGTARRISDYGVTPERYGLVALGFWLLLLIAWNAIRRDGLTPRLVLGSLAGLLLLASFGPWGAGAVSIASQKARLLTIMDEQGFFADGSLTVPERVSPEAAQQGYSIIQFLAKNRALDVLEPVLAGFETNPFADPRITPNANDLTMVLNMENQIDAWETSTNTSSLFFQSSAPTTMSVPDGMILSGVHSLIGDQPRGTDRTVPHVTMRDGNIVIQIYETEWLVDSARLIEDVRAAFKPADTYPPVTMRIPGEQGEAEIIVLSLDVRTENEESTINYGRILMLLPEQSQ